MLPQALRGFALLASIALAGCGGRTTPVSVASADPGEMGFGADIHAQSFGIARNVTAAIGHAAIVDVGLPAGQPGDALWQVHAGGRRLRHCTVTADRRHSCLEAQLPEPVRNEALVIIDPRNLGRSLTVTQFSAVGSGGYVHGSGPPDLHVNEPLPATPGHGIWVQRSSPSKAPWHCQVEADGRPRCRSLPGDANVMFVGNVFFFDGALGVFSVKDEDILWIARLMAIHRCTASRARPDPVCTPAKME